MRSGWRVSFRAQSFDTLKGKWINEWGSYIIIENIEATTGKVSGHFYFPNTPREKAAAITGWVSQAQATEGKDNVLIVSLATHWKDYGSIVSYNGYLQSKEGKNVLKTIYQTLKSNANYPFEHMGIESSSFTKAN